MLIRVLLPNKEGKFTDCKISTSYTPLHSLEGLFNANCLVAALLDAIKKKHELPRSGKYILYYTLMSSATYMY